MIPGTEPPALRSALRKEPKPGSPAVRAETPVEKPLATTVAAAQPVPAAAAPVRKESSAAAEARHPVAAEAGADPWDSQAAEALTQVYETSDVTVPPLRSMLGVMSGMGAPPVAARPAASAPPASNVTHAVADELAGLARRVEAALERLAPSSAVEGLATRFGALESRIAGALDGLARRADKDDRGVIAGHLEQLSRQVARTEQSLSRIDTIEQRLDVLAEKLTDEQIIALFGSLVPTAEDLAQFAEEAATRSADRALEAFIRHQADAPAGAAATAGPPTSGADLRAMNAMLATFMDDRRRSDAGTIEALETLQLAMQHLLDRIDQMDAGSEPSPTASRPGTAAAPTALLHHAAEPAAPPAPTRPVRSPTVARDRPASTLAPDEGVDRLGLGPAAVPQDLDVVPDAPAWSDRRTAPADLAPEQPGTGGSVPEQKSATRARVREAGAGTDAEPGAAAPVESPKGNDRKALIELARKAAERAKSEQAPKAPEEAKSRPLLQMPSFGRGKAEGDKQQIRPAVVAVAAAALLVLAGYWYVTGPGKSIRKHLPWAATEQTTSTPPRRAESRAKPPSGNAPDIETEARTAAPAAAAPAAPSEPAAKRPRAPDRTSLEPSPEEDSPRLDTAYLQGGPVEQTAAGIAVAGAEHRPTADAVIRARERARLAGLSQRAGDYASANLASTGTVAPAVTGEVPATGETSDPAPHRPAESSVVTGSLSTGSAPAGPVGSSGHQTLELPPAPIGPLSLRIAAAKGDPAAQLEIAARFAEGKGVPQSFADAADWYGRAAAQDIPIAQYRLAALYERGLGVAADPARARDLYERSAEAGNVKAMHNLAVLKAGGAGGTPDYAGAARLFSAAAERGLADSQYNLAILTESGHGVGKDLIAALKWYMLAAKAGDRDAGRRRDQLITRLPPDALQAANRAVTEWRPIAADPRANDVKVAGDAWRHRAEPTKR
ncbi:MAG: hypothetical protein SFW09_19220 [Hyphomicrobiaceae bacterium]|nr:hypothetical protein [Hyphomicrobiaceae bacterium]